jgi:hypothetical protein
MFSKHQSCKIEVIFDTQICRPSMRKVAAMRQGGCSSTSDMQSDSMSIMSSAVGNIVLGNGESCVSAITFDQHSTLVRYPNSMSNLRRLRCYLMACQVCFSIMYCHLGWRTLVLKCNKNNYD